MDTWDPVSLSGAVCPTLNAPLKGKGLHSIRPSMEGLENTIFYSFGKHVRFDIYCSACLYSCPISVKDDMIRQHFVADQSCTFSSARARLQKLTLIGKISSNVNLSQDKALPPKRDHMVAAFVAIPMRSRRRNDSEFY